MSRPSGLALLLVVVGTESWFHSGGTSSRTRYQYIAPIPGQSAHSLSFFIPGMMADGAGRLVEELTNFNGSTPGTVPSFYDGQNAIETRTGA